MKKNIVRMSSDQKSLFLKAHNAIINKTAIINIEKSPLTNLVIEKEDSKSLLFLQTDSSLIELMQFNTIEEAVDFKKYVESKIYKKSILKIAYSIIKKTTVVVICLSILISVPAYTYFKINQISEFNKLIALQKSKIDPKESQFNDMQNKVKELTNKPSLTPSEDKELNDIQKKLEQVNNNNNIKDTDDEKDELSKIQNRLIEFSKKPRESLTEEDKKEIIDMQHKLVAMDKNKTSASNQEVDNVAGNQQKHLDNMLNEIKEKSFK